VSTQLCSVEGCPLQIGGACLEAFDDPADCPNTSDVGLLSSVDEVPAPESEQFGWPTVDGSQSSASKFIAFDSGDSLGLSQANDLRAERPCRFILIAGEVRAGKSTLLAQLFGKFLKGSYEGWTFAGSKTLKAFDIVHAPSRASSGKNSPDTLRTPDEGMRFLHLRLSHASRVDLLLSELSGERFKSVINGASVTDLAPVSSVADRCIVLVDGDALLSASTRGRAFDRARRMIGGLTESGGILAGTPTLLLATKADLWLSVAEAEVAREMEDLTAFSNERGLNARSSSLAARPVGAVVVETGMPDVVRWMVEEDTTTPESSIALPQLGGRRFWQDRNE
jgi:hypothetical protein